MFVILVNSVCWAKMSILTNCQSKYLRKHENLNYSIGLKSHDHGTNKKDYCHAAKSNNC